MKINKTLLMLILIMRNITNDSMYIAQELHAFAFTVLL